MITWERGFLYQYLLVGVSIFLLKIYVMRRTFYGGEFHGDPSSSHATRVNRDSYIMASFVTAEKIYSVIHASLHRKKTSAVKELPSFNSVKTP